MLGLVGWALTTDPASRAMARALSIGLDGATGESSTVGAVRVAWWPPSVAVEGVAITHPPDGDAIVLLSRAQATLGREGWRPVLQRIELDSPQVRLHVLEDGLREFRALTSQPASDAPPASSFPWKELVIRDGLVELDAPGVAVAISGIQLAPDGPTTSSLDLAELVVTAGPLTQRVPDIHFGGVDYAPDHVRIPGFSLASDAVSIDGHLAAVVGGEVGGDLSLHVDVGALAADASHEGAALGVVDLDATIAGPMASPGLSGTLSTGGLSVRSGEAYIPIGALQAPWSVDLAAGNIVHAGPVSGEWGGGTVFVDATFDPGAGTVIAGVSAEGLSLAKVLQDVQAVLHPWVDFTADVDASLQVSLDPFLLEGPFDLDLINMVVDDGPVHQGFSRMLNVPRANLQGRVRSDADFLVFDVARAVAGRSTAKALAKIPLHEPGELSIDAHFSQLDLAALTPLGDAELGGLARVDGWLGGPYSHLRAWADVEGVALRVLDIPFADAFTAHLESPALASLEFGPIDANRGQTTWTGNFTLGFPPEGMRIDTEIDIPEGRVEDLLTMFLDHDGVTGRLAGHLGLHGPIYELDGAANFDLAGVNLEGESFGGGNAVAWMDDGRFTLERLVLNRRAETLLARGSIGAGWAANLEVLWDGARLETLDHLSDVSLPLTGDVALDARVNGTLFDPAPVGHIRVHDVRYSGRPVADSVLAFTSADGVLAWEADVIGSALQAKGTLGMWGEQPYALDAWLEDFPLHTFYPVAADGHPVQAVTSGVAHLEGHFGDHPDPVVIDLRLDEVEATWRSHRLHAPAPWVLCMHGLRVDLAGACDAGALAALEPEKTGDPASPVPVENPVPASENGGGPDLGMAAAEAPVIALVGNDGTALNVTGYATGKGDARFQFTGNIALDLLPAVVPELLEASGNARVDFVASRSGGGPIQTGGTVQVRNAEALSAWFPATFQDLHFDLEASPDHYRITDLAGRVGGGTIESAESRIDAKGWIPERYALRAQVKDARVQYLEYLPPMVADAELNFDGPGDDLLLSGKIQINSMEFRERIDWESAIISLQQQYLTGSAPEDESSYFRFDLQVSADETVHLRNNIADAEASADLRIVGDTARPGMVGSVVMTPGGSVFLQEREFEVTRGEAHWRDPYTFDPELDFVLHTDLESQEQSYDVAYQVSGPLSDWTTTTSSVPYLAQADINALLLFGMTREEMEGSGYGGLGTALVVETGDLLSAQLARPLVNPVVDRWSLVSGAAERGSAVVSDEPRLVAEIDDVAGFDMTVEGALSGDWYVAVERKIARRLYATAYATSDQIGRSVPFAAVGTEFKIRWEAD